VGIINHGQLVAEGTLSELRERAGGGGQGSASLEDVFLQVIGANQREGGLEWLE